MRCIFAQNGGLFNKSDTCLGVIINSWLTTVAMSVLALQKTGIKRLRNGGNSSLKNRNSCVSISIDFFRLWLILCQKGVAHRAVRHLDVPFTVAHAAVFRSGSGDLVTLIFSQAVSEHFQNGLSRCCYCCFLGTDGADVLAVNESCNYEQHSSLCDTNAL